MLVRIQLRKGHRVARKSGKNRNAAFTFAALLKPLALIAYVLGDLAAGFRYGHDRRIRVHGDVFPLADMDGDRRARTCCFLCTG